MSTAAETIARWALPLSVRDIPANVRQAATLRMLDGLGVALAAHRMNAAPYAVEVARSLGNAEESTIIGDASRVGAAAAALANGTLIHALDYDDTHTGALVHVTAAVLPAALAVGEQTGSSGAQVMAAVVAGYETVIRLGAAVTHGFHERGLHATSVCGVFASALIAAKLMDLSQAQTVNALGIAGSAAAGSLEFLATGSSTKQLHPGLAGMNGIVAARLAASGAQGPASILEGEHGLFAAYLGERVSVERIAGGLGQKWETPQIAVKLYPACQLLHSSMDALREALAGVEDVTSIEHVTFDIPKGSVPIVCEPAESKRRPRSAYEAKFSLAYCAASLIRDAELNLDSFQPHALERSDVAALAERVGYRTVVFDGPPADAPARVEVGLRDGRTLHAETPGGQASATPEAILAKFEANAGAGALIDQMGALEDLPTIEGLLR